jgi:3-methyladenine DNA glycosylase AlkD
MTVSDVLAELEALGTAQNRKIYTRHGVGVDQYGVSYANLKKLRKKIKVDHTLAQQLWASGIHDARVLATMIADPKQANDVQLEAWAADLSNYVITDAFTGFVAKTEMIGSKMSEWTGSEGEWIGQAGWQLLAHLALHDVALPDAFFEPWLETIEQEIHARKNRVRYAMNNALIAIGGRNEALAKTAIAAAGRIGEVDVDHGETNCKTPDAATYIRKMREREKAGR